MKKRRGTSFSTRIALNMVGMVTILFLVLMAVVGVNSRKAMSTQAEKTAMLMLESSIGKIERIIERVHGSLVSTSWMVLDNLDGKDELFRITSRTVEESEEIDGCAIAFREGAFPGEERFCPYSWYDESGCHSKRLDFDEYNYTEKSWFTSVMQSGRESWSEPYYDLEGGEMLMTTYSYPLIDEGGEIIAVLTADVRVDMLSDLIDSLKPYPNSMTMLVTKDGTVIASNLKTKDDEVPVTLFSIPQISETEAGIQVARSILEGRSGSSVIEGKDGERQFVCYGSMSNGWAVALVNSYDDILSPLIRMQLLLSLVTLLGIMVLGFLCYFILRRMTVPLKDLTHSVQQITDGNFDASLPEVSHDDELKRLRDSFGFMQKSLKAYIDDLKVSTAANERYRSELSIARAIQMGMLEKDFPHEGPIDAHATSCPAKEVGGDLYDFYIKNGKAYFAIGDVSGKGIPASMYMALTKSAFRFVSGMVDIDGALAKINNNLTHNNREAMFVTLFLGSLDLGTGVLDYCNAGHPPVLVVEPGGKASFLETKPNLAAGLVNAFHYEPQRVTLKPGTKLVLYTDGVTEAENMDMEQFGSERLCRWADECMTDGISAQEATESLMKAVSDFTGNIDQNDDITIMTVAFNPS